MPRLPLVQIKLSIPERRELRQIREYHPKRRYWLRAEIVLRADAGQSNLYIAQRLEISRNTVKQWRSRFAREGIDGLKDRPIPGRPRWSEL
ncbi:MAG: helix-turn-helix domain-containing protein [Elusimicrobia bacterium]|nr:helix-turn-helix domain-containing protein [Elusimicrobiota bacterium]